jgi:hypothetical protein
VRVGYEDSRINRKRTKMSEAMRYNPMVAAIEITTFRKIELVNTLSGVMGPVVFSTFSTALNARKNAEN